ncbi:MAG: sulfurtransferase TusA family protein [Actinobacteria bacterium]|nr:sulfurtransferase TusA family protein [Actinomycetota bacterium]
MIEVNSIGKRCPQPIIDVARAIGNIPMGESLVLLADDPATLPDLTAWSRMTGNAIKILSETNFLVTRQNQSGQVPH